MRKTARRPFHIRTWHQIIAIGTAALLVMATVTACGHGSSSASSAKSNSAGAYDDYGLTGDAAAPGMFSAKMADSEPMEMAEADDYDFNENSGSTTSGNAGDTVAAEKIPEDRKLIRNVSLTFETTEFDKFVTDIQRKTTELGGYIESSDISGSEKTSSKRNAYFTLRIPKPRVDDFLTFTESEGANLTRKYENTQDITLKYHDTESRKKALQEEYDRLLELIAKAESVDAIIAIEERLSDIRYQLDNFESDLRTFDNQVDYSTINVDVSEASVYTPTQKTGFWARVLSNLESNIEDLADAVTDFLVWLLSSLPVFIVLGIFIAVIWFVIRKILVFFKKRASKHAEKMAANMKSNGNMGNVTNGTAPNAVAPNKTLNGNPAPVNPPAENPDTSQEPVKDEAKDKEEVR
ncbi:DUF4349 domain-containing protein [Oribacterium sp. WCC10]|uniref:DUF4349 domain-containing protein n=1 Tax=Oribacterium sp. WCC10 TaxID=1855343 RepID=UPI0008EBEEF5|nr:DUF4349 domain-containing protein [Oribacterium sp. WCC10]SFG47785.1 protein of unknown function [Oribacterium sp. WCC10]